MNERDAMRMIPTMQGFQQRGEAHRRELGIDGSAGDAQDVRHPFVVDEGFGPWCVICGLGENHRKHPVRPAE